MSTPKNYEKKVRLDNKTRYSKNKFKDTPWVLIRTETTMSATDESNNSPVDSNNNSSSSSPVDSNSTNSSNSSNNSSTNSSSNSSSSSSSTRLTGRVKWFNNKTGFGFITALGDSEGVKEGSDVFVHHSTIKVAQEQYRYLVQGEYVDFVLSKIADASNKHEFQAADVSGVKGGKLICETRWESRTMSGGGGSSEPRFKRASDGLGLGGGWKTVESRTTSIFAPRQSGSEWRRGDSSSSGRGRGRGGTD